MLPMEQLGARAHAWSEALQPVYVSWKQHELSDPEAASLYLCISLQFWFEGDWISGLDPLGIGSVPLSKLLFPWLKLDGRSQRKTAGITTIAELINNFSFKSIRKDARLALIRWLKGEIDLSLSDGIPTPGEVLAMQVEGRRLVSALFKPGELNKLVHDGRDALSFLLHDLGHAEKFFGSGFEPDAQIGCYRLLKRALDAGKLDSLSEFDPDWNDRLHYLIADLNSHPVHILSVFWAMAREAFFRASRAADFEVWRREIFELWNWEDSLAEAHNQVIKNQCPESAALIFKKLKSVPAGADQRPVRSSV